MRSLCFHLACVRQEERVPPLNVRAGKWSCLDSGGYLGAWNTRSAVVAFRFFWKLILISSTKLDTVGKVKTDCWLSISKADGKPKVVRLWSSCASRKLLTFI